MTTYSTDQDIEKRLGERILTQLALADSGEAYDPAIVDEARQYGYNLINLKLFKLYGQWLPFVGAAIPPVVADLEVSFAVYWLATRSQQAGEMYIENYKAAMKILDGIASGSDTLVSNGVILSPETQPAPALAISSTRGQTPIFSRKTTDADMQR